MTTSGAPAGWQVDYSHIGEGRNGQIGIVLVHGFTGAPASMRPWAEFLVNLGYSVRVPRLPGHATDWKELNRVAWSQWPDRVLQDLEDLRRTCTKVFIFGLSMGGCVTLNVAQHHAVDGIVLVNPMIHIPGIQVKFAPLISMIKPGLAPVANDIKKPDTTEWGYDILPTKGVVQLNKMLKATRLNLINVTAPTLLFHSVDDHVLPKSNSDIVMNEIGSLSKQRIEMTNSYHVAVLDFDAPIIFANALAHVERFSE
jgi:carboxylesterase